jgi:RNA polymerase sigma-70 factor, ECF subfamily
MALAQRPLKVPVLRLVEPPARSPERGDGELVARTLNGERGAFEELYRRHASRAMALAVRIQGHAGDVEDVVHDAFVRAHDHLHTLENGDVFRSWIGSIVVRLVRSRLRRRRFLRRIGFGSADSLDVDAVLYSGASPEQKLELTEVYAALQTLEIEQQIAWTLRYVDGDKLEDVAVATGASLATVKRRILAAQIALTAALGTGQGSRLVDEGGAK